MRCRRPPGIMPPCCLYVVARRRTLVLSFPSPPPTSKNTTQVAAVKALYREMGLEGVFKAYEEASYAEITKELDALPSSLPRVSFGYNWLHIHMSRASE